MTKVFIEQLRLHRVFIICRQFVSSLSLLLCQQQHKHMLPIPWGERKYNCFLFIQLTTYEIFYDNKKIVTFFFFGILHAITVAARPSCHWQYCILLEQEQRKDYKLSLYWGQVHLESVSSPVTTGKWRQGCLSKFF